MARLPKCKYCDNEVDKTLEHVKISSRYYHKECYEKHKLEQREKKARKCGMCGEKVYIGDEGTQKDYKDYYHHECFEKKKRIAKNREELLDYVAELYEVQYPNPFMIKQADDFYKKRGYSYKSMKATLYYIYEIEGVQLKKDAGLGLIPYYYEKAKKHFLYINNAKNAIKEEKIIINNNAEKIQAVISNRRKSRKIDIGNL